MKSFEEIIQQLAEVNDMLINGKVKIETAKQIAANTQVIVNAAKVYIDYCKIHSIKNNFFFPEYFGTIEDSIKEIDERNKKPYEFSKNL